jgi:hypothetical protein
MPLVRTWSLISALLLLVQVLGLAHLAFAAHTVDGTGSVVDAVELSSEEHQHPSDHLCAGDVNVHALHAADECLVAATWKTAGVLEVVVVPDAPLDTVVRPRVAFIEVDFGLAALARAPKASPPLR